ncbi:hypothetical protein Tco_0591959, partial [Tanacetum coccineum]
THQSIDIRGIPSGLLFSAGLAITWEFPKFRPLFKDPEGHVVTMSEYLRLPFLSGMTIEAGEALTEQDVIPQHTTTPLSDDEQVPGKTDSQQRVEASDPKIVATRIRKAHAAAKRKAEKNRESEGAGGSEGSSKRRKPSSGPGEGDKEKPSDHIPCPTPLRTIEAVTSDVSRGENVVSPTQAQGDNLLEIPAHDSANTIPRLYEEQSHKHSGLVLLSGPWCMGTGPPSLCQFGVLYWETHHVAQETSQLREDCLLATNAEQALRNQRVVQPKIKKVLMRFYFFCCEGPGKPASSEDCPVLVYAERFLAERLSSILGAQSPIVFAKKETGRDAIGSVFYVVERLLQSINTIESLVLFQPSRSKLVGQASARSRKLSWYLSPGDAPRLVLEVLLCHPKIVRVRMAGSSTRYALRSFSGQSWSLPQDPASTHVSGGSKAPPSKKT